MASDFAILVLQSFATATTTPTSRFRLPAGFFIFRFCSTSENPLIRHR